MSSLDMSAHKRKHYNHISSYLPQEVLEALTPKQTDDLIERIAYLIYQGEMSAIGILIKKGENYKHFITSRHQSVLMPKHFKEFSTLDIKEQKTSKQEPVTLDAEEQKTLNQAINKKPQKQNRLLELTLEDVYASQYPSDMFFNHEWVADAYHQAVTNRKPEKDISEAFIDNLKAFWSEEHAEIIANDFLARV